MGGPGSGRRSRKLTVEECLFLDIDELVRRGLAAGGKAPVFVKSASVLRKKQVGSIDFDLGGVRKAPVLSLRYVVEWEGERQEVIEPIHLETTRPHFGGVRWWFTCPFVVDGTPCGRRVGKLYLPVGRRYFGCRHCYDLTYRSCQESHKSEWLYALIAGRMPGVTPAQVKRAMSLVLG